MIPRIFFNSIWQRCCHFFSRRGYGADNTNKLPSAKVATEARPINYAWSFNFHLPYVYEKNKIKRQFHAENKYEIDNKFQQHQHQHWNPVPVGMEESGLCTYIHKQSILRNKEVPKKNAPHKPRDVTRPTVMVKRYGFRGTLSTKYKIDFWNNLITASVLVWNQVVLNQSQQLGYLNSKLMLSWDCPFNCENTTDYSSSR